MQRASSAKSNAKQRMQQQAAAASSMSADPADPLNDSCTIPPSDDEADAEAEEETAQEHATFIPPSPTRLRRLRRASSPPTDLESVAAAASSAAAVAADSRAAAAPAASPAKSSTSGISRATSGVTGMTRADMQKRVAQRKADADSAAAASSAVSAAAAVKSPRTPQSISRSRSRRSSAHESVVIPESGEEIPDPFAGTNDSSSSPLSSPAAPRSPVPAFALAAAASSTVAPSPAAAAGASAEWRPVRPKLANRSDIASHAAALKARSTSSASSVSSKSRSRSSSPDAASAPKSKARSSPAVAAPASARTNSKPKPNQKAAARRAPTPSKTRGTASKKVWVQVDDDEEDESDGRQAGEQASPAVKSESDETDAPQPRAAPVHRPASSTSAAATATPSPPSTWSCIRCTLENDLGAKACSMCDTKRPASASASAAKSKSKPAAAAAAARSKKGRMDDSSDDGEAEPSSSEEEDAKAKAKRIRKPAAASRSTGAGGSKKRSAFVPNERSLRDCFPSLPSSSQLSSTPPPASRYADESAPPQRERSKLKLTTLDRTRSSEAGASSPTKSPGAVPVAPVSGSKGKRVYHDLTVSQSQSQTQSQQSQSQWQGGDEESEVAIVDRGAVEQAAVDRAKRRKLAASSSSAAASGKLALTLHTITSTPPSARPARSASSLADSGLPSSVPSVLWIDKYAPHSEEDLCMHRAKLGEIKAWLTAFGRPTPPPRSPLALLTAAREGRDARYGHGQSLLILAGPAGSAKSATIRVLASKLGYDVVTWDSEADTFGDGGGEWEGHTFSRYERKLSRFQSFFKISSRFALNLRPATQDESVRKADTNGAAAIGAGSKPKSLVVIDGPDKMPECALKQFGLPAAHWAHVRACSVRASDLPYIEKPEYRAEFLSILTSAVQSALHPLVLMLTTEHESSSCDHLLEKTFGAPFLAHPKVGVIKVNPVNNTEMIRALERVVRGEQLLLSKDTMTSVLSSCSGDIRHAISALQFLNVEHTANFDPKMAGKATAAGKTKKPRRTKKQIAEEAAAAAAAGGDDAGSVAPAPSVRDESFSVFHSVGKILYAKPDEQREVHDIIKASDIEPLEFMQWINTNYLEHLFAPQLPKPQPQHAASKPASVSTQAATAAKPSTAPASSAGRSPFDDFGPDLDMDSFDQLIQSSVAAAAAAPVQTHSLVQVQQRQAAMDEEALRALVECTHAFSDADVLAAGARGRFGDSGAADEAVEERAAAEIACRQFMQSKRSFSWANNAQLAPKKTGLTGARGPLSSKLFFLVRDKRRLFADLFQSAFVSSAGEGGGNPREFDLGTFMAFIQGEVPASARTLAILNRMRGFLGRDMMAHQARELWLDVLPHLAAIAAAPQQQTQQAGQMRGRPPPFQPQQQQPQQYRPQPPHMHATGQQRYPPAPMQPAPPQMRPPSMPGQLHPPTSNFGMRGPSPPMHAAASYGRPGAPPAAAAAASSAPSHLWSNSASARPSYLTPPPAALPLLVLTPQLTPLQLQYLRGCLTAFHPQSTVESVFKEAAASVEALQAQLKRVGRAAATGQERMGGAAAGQSAAQTTTWLPSTALLGDVEEIED